MGDWASWIKLLKMYNAFMLCRSAVPPKISRLLKCLLGAYLALFFALALPLHHHADNRTHGRDCHICETVAQTLIANAGPSAVIIVVFSLVATFSRVAAGSPRQKSPHLRGPPVF